MCTMLTITHLLLPYPLCIVNRFGTTLFFEHPITNPFGHEERFMLYLEDPRRELRVVSAIDEWIHLRQKCRPHTGTLGSEPVEADMFDREEGGHVHVAMLPHETLHIPFAFLTLLPHTGSQGRRLQITDGSRRAAAASDRTRNEGKTEGKEDDRAAGGSSSSSYSDFHEDEEPSRQIEVRIVSCTHGHTVAVIRVNIHPRPFTVHRTLRFFEPENNIMRHRIQLVSHGTRGVNNGHPSTKFIHCIELEGSDHVSERPHRPRSKAGAHSQAGSKVVVEWGPTQDPASTSAGGHLKHRIDSLDIILRYKCGDFPTIGNFFLLIYDDEYHSQLSEVCALSLDRDTCMHLSL